MTVANKLVHRGELEVSRKPLRREGRSVSACTCGQRAPRATLLRGGPGCSGHPAFPAPSVFSEGHNDAQLGRNAPRECGLVPSPSSCPRKRASSTPRPFCEASGLSGILDRPPDPVIGLAEGETRWRTMTAE